MSIFFFVHKKKPSQLLQYKFLSLTAVFHVSDLSHSTLNLLKKQGFIKFVYKKRTFIQSRRYAPLFWRNSGLRGASFFKYSKTYNTTLQIENDG